MKPVIRINLFEFFALANVVAANDDFIPPTPLSAA
jgi:hypothetical protein